MAFLEKNYRDESESYDLMFEDERGLNKMSLGFVDELKGKFDDDLLPANNNILWEKKRKMKKNGKIIVFYF